jgi:hypothetical protein
MNPKIDKWCKRLEWIDAQSLEAQHLQMSNNPDLSTINEFHEQIIPSLENAKMKIKKMR